MVGREGACESEVGDLGVAFRVEQNIGWLQIAVQNIGRVQVLQTFHDLVDYVLLMNFLQDVRSDHSMQVDLHRIEHQIDISVVLRTDHIQ